MSVTDKADVIETSTIGVSTALRMVGTALAEAARLECRIAVVVIDSGGGPVAEVRGDGVAPTVTTIARNKANTALTLRVSTGDFAETVKANPVLLASLSSQPGIALMAGGVPLVLGGTVIGAVGVSGGRGDQDPLIAQVAAGVLGQP